MVQETTNNDRAIKRLIAKYESQGMEDVRLLGEDEKFYHIAMAKPIRPSDVPGQMIYSFQIVQEEKAI